MAEGIKFTEIELEKYPELKRRIEASGKIEPTETKKEPEVRYDFPKSPRQIRREEHEYIEGLKSKAYESRPDMKALRAKQSEYAKLKTEYEKEKKEFQEKQRETRREIEEKARFARQIRASIPPKPKKATKTEYRNIQKQIRELKKAHISRSIQRPIPQSRPVRRVFDFGNMYLDIPIPESPIRDVETNRKGKKGSFMGLEEFAGI